MTATPLYCIDTSAILEAGVRYYPMDTFVGLWERFDDLINAGRLVAPVDVLHELSNKADGVYSWAQERRHIFVELDADLQQATRRVIRDVPNLINARKLKDGADPFVVALALSQGATVVTQERKQPEGQRPKIPNACDIMGVPCITLLELIRHEGWKF